MKNVLKRITSVFLAITIIFSSALVGLGEIDFSKLKFDNSFAVKTKAANSGTCGENVTWTLSEDGTLTISGLGNMYSFYFEESPWYGKKDEVQTVVINTGVTSIGETAFFDCKNLTTIIIPDTVKKIEGWAFYRCDSLISVKIPDGVTSIGYAAFSVCRSLTSITLPTGIKNISDYTFDDCISLTSVNIPDGVTSIGERVFYGCTNVTSIIIPNSVTSIGKYAFFNCNKLVSITIPASVTSIGEGAFEYCGKVNVSDGNDNYSSLDGALFNKNKTTLIHYPANIETAVYKIPDTVTNFTEITFSDCNIETIILSRGMTNITANAFRNSDNLKAIVIPSTIKFIGNQAFSGTWGLKDVFYEGTQSQWGSVSIVTGNDNLTNAKLHYNVDVENWGTHYGEPVTKQEPTCARIGLYTYICPCGYEKTEELPMLEHNYSNEWTIDSKATCEYSGSKSRHCLKCNSRTDVTEIPATGVHTPSEWYIEYNATCTREGSKYRRCTDCWETLERETIPKKEHTPSVWYTEKVATVNSAGSKYRRCTSCGQRLETAKIPQLKCSKPKLSKIENTTSGVKITWGKVSGADKYDVYRKTGSGSYKKIGTTSKTYYTDKKASSGKKYYYYVKAVNEAGASSASSSKSILYLADTTLSTPKSTKSGITLKWKKVTGADGYLVYRKTGSGSYSKIATVKGNSKVTYTDKKAKKGKTYTYKIKAYKSKTYSAYSNTKKIKDKY